jgi:hypothetical protein
MPTEPSKWNLVGWIWWRLGEPASAQGAEAGNLRRSVTRLTLKRSAGIAATAFFGTALLIPIALLGFVGFLVGPLVLGALTAISARGRSTALLLATAIFVAIAACSSSRWHQMHALKGWGGLSSSSCFSNL